MLTTDPGTRLTKLRDRFADAITLAGDAEWDQARSSFNLLIDRTPSAVARPRSAAEAAELWSRFATAASAPPRRARRTTLAPSVRSRRR